MFVSCSTASSGGKAAVALKPLCRLNTRADLPDYSCRWAGLEQGPLPRQPLLQQVLRQLSCQSLLLLRAAARCDTESTWYICLYACWLRIITTYQHHVANLQSYCQNTRAQRYKLQYVLNCNAIPQRLCALCLSDL